LVGFHAASAEPTIAAVAARATQNEPLIDMRSSRFSR
jgi:hypothetical protein